MTRDGTIGFILVVALILASAWIRSYVEAKGYRDRIKIKVRGRG